LRLLPLTCLTPPLDRHSFPTRRSSVLSCCKEYSSPTAIVLSSSTSNICMSFDSFNQQNTSIHRIISACVRQLIFLSVSKISIFRSEEHTSELQSRFDLVCRLLLDRKEV